MKYNNTDPGIFISRRNLGDVMRSNLAEKNIASLGDLRRI